MPPSWLYHKYLVSWHYTLITKVEMGCNKLVFLIVYLTEPCQVGVSAKGKATFPFLNCFFTLLNIEVLFTLKHVFNH